MEPAMNPIMELIKDVLAAIGGAVGIILLFLTFFKGILQKYLETMIEGAANKGLAKLTNTLQRRTTAYEMLLQREFSFYEKASNLISELIVDIMDYTFDLGVSEDYPDMHDYNKAKETALRILRFIPAFKRESLLAHTYLPDDVDKATVKLLSDLQKSCSLIHGSIRSALSEGIDSNTAKAIRENEKLTLLNCALVNLTIKTRLSELSKE